MMRTWTIDKLQALKKLEEVSHQTSLKRRDWQYAINICFKEARLLNLSPRQLSKTWSDYKNYFKGKCQRCSNLLDSKEYIHCSSCRSFYKIEKQKLQGPYSNEYIFNNKDKILKYLIKEYGSELAEEIYNILIKSKMRIKKRILGDNWED